MTPATVAYLDASAVARTMLADEPGRDRLRAALEPFDWHLSSRVVTTEVLRAIRRRSPGNEQTAIRHLAAMSLLDVSPDVLYGAAYLSPAEVSALDAIHVATALLLGNALGAFFTYDRGQTEMARGCGLSVQSPGT